VLTLSLRSMNLTPLKEMASTMVGTLDRFSVDF
jgi:hypothetical protein